MTDPESIDEIRQRKMERLREGDVGDDPESPPEPIHVDGAASLRETVAEHEVVLVDFYADWCGPCQMLEPTVAAIANDTAAVVAKVDVDANQPLATEYDVQGIPTLVLFADGEPVERLVGMQDEASLRQTVAQYT